MKKTWCQIARRRSITKQCKHSPVKARQTKWHVACQVLRMSSKDMDCTRFTALDALGLVQGRCVVHKTSTNGINIAHHREGEPLRWALEQQVPWDVDNAGRGDPSDSSTNDTCKCLGPKWLFQKPLFLQGDHFQVLHWQGWVTLSQEPRFSDTFTAVEDMVVNGKCRICAVARFYKARVECQILCSLSTKVRCESNIFKDQSVCYG